MAKKQTLDLSQFVQFTHTGHWRSPNTDLGKIKCKVFKHKTKKDRRIIKLYFYESNAKYLQIKKGDRALLLHKNDDVNKLLFLKHDNGTTIYSPANPGRQSAPYYIFCMTTDCAELEASEQMQTIDPIFHPKGIIELHINQK